MAESQNMSSPIIWQDRKHHLWFPWSFTKYYIQDERLMICLLYTSKYLNMFRNPQRQLMKLKKYYALAILLSLIHILANGRRAATRYVQGI